MPSCSSICAGTIPASSFGASCAISKKYGGIKNLVFILCDVDPPFNATLDGQNVNAPAWQLLIDDCKIRISNEIKGGLTEAEGEKIKTSSCRPAESGAKTLTLAFEDYGNTVSGGDIDFWNWIVENQAKLKVGWFTCDEDFFGFWDFAIYVSSEIPDDNTKFRLRKGAVEIIEKDIIKPIHIKGLSNLLLNNAAYDCQTSNYANDYEDYIDGYDFEQNG